MNNHNFRLIAWRLAMAICLFLLPANLLAQEEDVLIEAPAQPVLQPVLTFGYYSQSTVLSAMRDYVAAQAAISDMRAKYEAEAKRSEEDFNVKYEEFLEGMSTYPEAILQKRQAELQNQMERNVEFRRQAKELLVKAEADALQPVYQRLQQAVAAMAERFGLSFVLNTDSDACPYVNPSMGTDIGPAIIEHLSR